MAAPWGLRKQLVATKATAAAERIDPAWDPELSAAQRHLSENLEEAQRALKRGHGARKAVVVAFLGTLALGFYGYVFRSLTQEWFFGDREEAATDGAAKSATS